MIAAGAPERARIAGLLDKAADGFKVYGMPGWLGRATEQRRKLDVTARPSAHGVPRHPTGLTSREIDVLRRVAAGKTNREIAAELVLSVPTVERHVANIYAKIGASRRIQAAQFAVRHGLGLEAARHTDGISTGSDL
jgi:DNA-binding NarL/FixJ family response regulator